MADVSTARASDRSLIERLRRRDDRALATLYDRHATPVYSLALSIVKEPAEAEEIVADVYVRLWQDPGRYDPDRGSPAAYLMMLARSRALDRLRARSRRRAAVARAAAVGEHGAATPVSEPGEPPQRAVERREAGETVARALAGLSDVQRQAIELAYFGGLSQTEIAAELDAPLGTVKTRIRDGMRKLRAALTDARSEAAGGSAPDRAEEVSTTESGPLRAPGGRGDSSARKDTGSGSEAGDGGGS